MKKNDICFFFSFSWLVFSQVLMIFLNFKEDFILHSSSNWSDSYLFKFIMFIKFIVEQCFSLKSFSSSFILFISCLYIW